MRKAAYDPVEFPGAGFNHTYADPPTYYLVTAPLTSVVQKVTGLDSMVTAARSVGVLWLGAGLATTWALALRSVRVDALPSAPPCSSPPPRP